MSAWRARFARSTRAMSGLRSGRSAGLDIRKDSFQYIDRNPYSIRRHEMDAEHYRHLVAELFPCAPRQARRSTAVAIEHELLTADTQTGAAVPVDRVRAAVEGAGYAPYVGF